VRAFYSALIFRSTIAPIVAQIAHHNEFLDVEMFVRYLFHLLLLLLPLTAHDSIFKQH
jgi:hypothetical protein